MAHAKSALLELPVALHIVKSNIQYAFVLNFADSVGPAALFYGDLTSYNKHMVPFPQALDAEQKETVRLSLLGLGETHDSRLPDAPPREISATRLPPHVAAAPAA